MFIRDTTKTVFQVMYDFDNTLESYQRAENLRDAVTYYNEYSGQRHNAVKLIPLYWIFCEAL